MSWAIFKNNIISKSVDTMGDIDVVANLWAKEYDAAVKRGNDSVNFVNVQTGNVPLMEKFFKVALQIGLTQNTPTYSLVTQMGQGVLAYWSNAILNPFFLKKLTIGPPTVPPIHVSKSVNIFLELNLFEISLSSSFCFFFLSSEPPSEININPIFISIIKTPSIKKVSCQ